MVKIPVDDDVIVAIPFGDLNARIFHSPVNDRGRVLGPPLQP
jgi:hypothetical protein